MRHFDVNETFVIPFNIFERNPFKSAVKYNGGQLSLWNGEFKKYASAVLSDFIVIMYHKYNSGWRSSQTL